MFGWFETFWRRHVVQDVPADLVSCEFDCGAGECGRGHWLACPKRIAEVLRETEDEQSLLRRADAANERSSAS